MSQWFGGWLQFADLDEAVPIHEQIYPRRPFPDPRFIPPIAIFSFEQSLKASHHE